MKNKPEGLSSKARKLRGIIKSNKAFDCKQTLTEELLKKYEREERE